MNKDINLVSSKRRGSADAERSLKITKIIAFISLACVASISLLFFFLDKNSSLPTLKTQETNLIANMTYLHPKIAQYLILKERLQSIDTIISGRTSYEDSISQIIKALPSSVVVASFSFNQKAVSLTLVTPSLQDANSFIDAMISKVNNRQLFRKMTIDNIIADEKSGKYTVLIDAIPL